MGLEDDSEGVKRGRRVCLLGDEGLNGCGAQCSFRALFDLVSCCKECVRWCFAQVQWIVHTKSDLVRNGNRCRATSLFEKLELKLYLPKLAYS